MGLIHEEDTKRYFISLAFEASEQMIHPISGFIQKNGVAKILDNLYGVLALSGIKQIDAAQKGQELLKKLLPFKDHRGLFCEYIHSYPASASHLYQIECALVLYELFTLHPKSIGQELSSASKQIFNQIVDVIFSNEDLTSPKYQLKYQILEYLSKNLHEKAPLYSPKKSSRDLSNYFLYIRFFDDYEAKLKEFSNLWHPAFKTYTGPCLNQYYQKTLPECTLFDYFMAAAYQITPDKFQVEKELSLLGALIKIPKQKVVFAESMEEGDYRGCSYVNIQKADSHLFYFSNYDHLDESSGFHLMRWMFLEDQTLFHFVCQSKMKKVNAQLNGSSLVIDFIYPEVFGDDMESQKELEFYINKSALLKCFVNETKATLFHLGDTLMLKTNHNILTCSWSLLEGEGEVNGHLSFGNRPSQIEKIGFEAYDHRISLRTLRRSSHFVIRMRANLCVKSICSGKDYLS